MLIYSLIYLIFALGALTALSVMILRIGALLETCPDNGPSVRPAIITVATGFAAIGSGGVILIGALVPMLSGAPLVGFFAALGLTSLCLGLGFTQAMATLRAVLDPPPVAEPAPMPA